MIRIAKILFLAFSLINLLPINAQNFNEDSLMHVLNTSFQSSVKINTLNVLSAYYLNESPGKSKQFAEQAFLLSEKTDNKPGRAMALFNLASNDANNQDIISALNKYYEAHEIFRDLGLDKEFAATCVKIGLIYKVQFQFDQALFEFYEAMEVLIRNGLKNELAELNNNIGGVFYDQGKYDRAFDYYVKSLKLHEELGNLKGIASANNNIGEIYRLNEQYSIALDYYKKSVRINELLNRKSPLAINFDNIGNLYGSLGQNDTAFYYLKKSYLLGMENNNETDIARACISLGNLCLAEKDYDQAILHFEKALNLPGKGKKLLFLKNATEGLSSAFAGINDYRNAYEYYNIFRNLSDSIFNVNNLENIAQLEMELIFKQEQEISKLQQEKRMIRYFALAAGLVSLVILFLLLYGRLKIRIKHSKTIEINLQLEKKSLTEEIDYKNRELATSVMYLVKKNELINFITEKLIKAKLKFKKENQKLIQEIIVELQSNIDINIWKNFETRFNEVHNQFYDKLLDLFPNLTDNDKKLAAFLKLNLTTKEIASITHQNPRSIEVARTRLRKKIGLSNTDINLTDYLSKL